MILAYVVYGLSFFLLWTILLVYNASLHKYGIMRNLWLLALFAITHGLHDWIMILMNVERYAPAYLRVFNLGLLALSFYFLIQFGFGNGIIRNKYPFLKGIPIALILLWVAATAASGQKVIAGDVFARYFMGFPGSIMTGYALVSRLKKEKGIRPALSRNMALAAGSFLGYAFFAGLVVPPADFYPASALNYVTFADKVGVPVQFFRALCVMAMTYGLSRVFYIFDMNLRDSLERSKEALENAVRERTVELMTSNERLRAEIQGRKLVEETLFARERQQNAILGNIPDLAWLMDREGRYIAVNDAFAAACGMKPEDLVGKTSLDVWPKELAEKHLADDRKVMEMGRRKQVEETMVDRLGNRVWVETIKTPIFDDKGLVAGMAGIARNITGRKLAEDKVRESEARYRNLFESLTDGIFILDLDGNFIDANRTAYTRLGYTKEELLSLNISKIDHPAIAHQVPEKMEQIRAHGSLVFECAHLRKDGTVMPVEVNSHLIEHEGRKMYLAVIRDITERKQAEAELQRRDKQLVESQRIAHIGSWERNLATGAMFWSDELFRIFKLDPKAGIVDFNGFYNMIHPDDRPAFTRAVDETIRFGKPYGIDYRVVLKDGTIRIIHAQAELRVDETGTQAILSGTAQDVTERRLVEEKVRQSEAKYRNLFESSMDGIFILDEDGHILDLNTAAYTRLGYAREEMLGVHISKLDPPEFAPRVPERLQQVRERGFAVFESAHVRKDGTAMPVEINSRVIEYAGRTAFFSIIRDITERKRMEEEIRHMAQHDALTGLPNRMLFADILKIEVAQARRKGKRLAILYLDLDRFKEINDTLGHDAGDQLLKQVSVRLTKSVRESDSVARIGGDEFNVLLADVSDVEDVTDVVQKLLSAFQPPFRIADHVLPVTTSIGISIYPDDSMNIDILLRYSDIAMYYAKERGRNNFQFYDPEINSRSIERIRLEGMLRQTINRGELVIYYQPQVNIKTREMVCAEALVRWKHPEQGILEPGRFISAAEDTGFITAIDEYVLRHACLDIAAWVEAGIQPVCVTVNLSAREFQDPDLSRKIAGILEETGAPARYLMIEITETMAMSNIERTIERLNELARMGVHIAIDDFGTGYSSLNHLKRLPVENLKIDKSFIQDITTDADDRTIINAVTAMAHTMKLKVTAEGVETVDQLEFLKELDCDEAQGYLFSSPLPEEQFLKLLTASG